MNAFIISKIYPNHINECLSNCHATKTSFKIISTNAYWSQYCLTEDRHMSSSNPGSDNEMEEVSKKAKSSPSPSSSSGGKEQGGSTGVRMMKKKSREDTKMRSSCNCDELRYVHCTLETKDLWDKFHDLETEMIITKTGR